MGGTPAMFGGESGSCDRLFEAVDAAKFNPPRRRRVL